MTEPDWSESELEGWHAKVEDLATAHRAHRHSSDAMANALGDAMIIAMDRGEIELASALGLLRMIRQHDRADKALTALNHIAADLAGVRRN